MGSILIQGIKYDAKSSFMEGASLAPPLIREALNCGSMNYFTEDGQSIEAVSVIDKGDFEISDYFDIEQITAEHLQLNSKILSLGGDHSITFPIVKAHRLEYPKIDILHIDAHTDLYDQFEGDPYSHACPFARIMELDYVERLVQVGIRTLTAHQADQAMKFNVEIHQMRNLDFSQISEFENPVYISLDLDAFDPAYAPGVSHHEPGGLSTRQVLDLIHNLKAEIIGADIVEYNPHRDIHNMTATIGAKMLKELIAKMN